MSVIFESVTTSVSGIKDRKEFVTGEGRLVTGEKGFVVDRREYITVCKDRKRVRKGSQRV